jgi:hypothetical protein
MVLLVCVVIGAFLLVLVYMLPTDEMKENVARSHNMYDYEGTYPEVIDGYKSYQLDNNTDGLMLLQAVFPGNDDAFRNSLLNPYYVDDVNNSMQQVLNDYANDVNRSRGIVYYSRYWHGYLLYLKPLLLFFDIGDIRVINTILQLALIMILFYLMISRGYKNYLIPLFCGLIVISPTITGLSFQYTAVFYIMLLGMIFMLTRKYSFLKKGDYLYYFVLIGIATSFMDFLTYPIVTLGMPLCVYLIIDKTPSVRKRIAHEIKLIIAWAFGYYGMWASKWIVAYVFTGEKVIQDAIQETNKLTSNTDGANNLFSLPYRISAIIKIIGVLCRWPYVLLFTASMCFIVFRIARKSGRKHILTSINRSNLFYMLATCLPYLIIALLPLVQAILMPTHTEYHYWFTYKNLAVTVFSLLAWISELGESKCLK